MLDSFNKPYLSICIILYSWLTVVLVQKYNEFNWPFKSQFPLNLWTYFISFQIFIEVLKIIKKVLQSPDISLDDLVWVFVTLISLYHCFNLSVSFCASFAYSVCFHCANSTISRHYNVYSANCWDIFTWVFLETACLQNQSLSTLSFFAFS